MKVWACTGALGHSYGPLVETSEGLGSHWDTGALVWTWGWDEWRSAIFWQVQIVLMWESQCFLVSCASRSIAQIWGQSVHCQSWKSTDEVWHGEEGQPGRRDDPNQLQSGISWWKWDSYRHCTVLWSWLITWHPTQLLEWIPSIWSPLLPLSQHCTILAPAEDMHYFIQLGLTLLPFLQHSILEPAEDLSWFNRLDSYILPAL